MTTDDVTARMEWTTEGWNRFTAALAAALRERFGAGELLAIDDRTLFAYRAGAAERCVSVDDTDEPPRQDGAGAFYGALVSESAGFEPERTTAIQVRF